MLTITDERDILESERIKASDPFQFGEPCWMVSVFPKLPPEVSITVSKIQIEERDRMAVKLIEEKEAPRRLHVRSGISSSQEFSDILTAMRALPPGKAIVLTIESTDLLAKKKPEVTLAGTLRRYFVKNSIKAEAYQSGKNEITVKRALAVPTAKKRKG
jgi:hypothetical protein